MPTDATPANNPNAGPEPVHAEPNHVREKTYRDPTIPKAAEDAMNDLPEATAQDKVRDDIGAAAEGVKKRL